MDKAFYNSNFKLGILGGGQLGRMFIQEAINYNASVHILDPSELAPCKDIATSFTQGDLMDYSTVVSFGQNLDLLTIEIEHVNVDALETLEKEGVEVYPQPHILRMIQDKGTQKEFYKEHSIPTAPFILSDSFDYNIELPVVQKLRKGGYDGKGVQILRDKKDLIHGFHEPSVFEDLIDFEKELSVIVARNTKGEVKTFPVVELEFNPEANLVEYLFSPAAISQEVEQKAQDLAIQVAESTKVVGLLAVEMFLTKDGEVMVNEIAPRPHNSGHQTIEGNITSQFEQHLRAITGMPLGDTSILAPSVMVNLLGEKDHTGEAFVEGLEEVMAISGATVHLYGKWKTKPYRKMGHVTVVDKELESAKEKAKKIKDTLKIKTR
jgi:5-(carboxyamino)imidazole ribonucleotide synthase